MQTKITEGVKVSVQTAYQAEQSNPANGIFLFSYQIKMLLPKTEACKVQPDSIAYLLTTHSN